jgi:hypothetical protein
MTPDYCELDPDGDVILILERRYEEDEGEEGVSTDDPPSLTEDVPAEDVPAEEAPDEWIKCPEVEEIPVNDPPGPMEETPAEAVPAYDSPALIGETLTGKVRNSEKRPKSEHIRIKVSSKHLILASPYFRSMLQSNFKEGMNLRTTRATEIWLISGHPVALLILLNIIHGHTRRVMEELHTDSIDGGHEASYGARSRARERAYSNKEFLATSISACSRGLPF